jgi:hypothetical protein
MTAIVHVASASVSPSKEPSLSELKTAIAHSVTITSAPNIYKTIPPLPSLNTDDAKLPGFNSPCSTTTGSAVPQNAVKLCRFGDSKAKRTILVLGDSQAAMWLVALSPIAKQLHWNLVAVAHDGCPPWPDQSTTDIYGDPSNGCQSFVNSELALERTLRPQVVIPVGDGFHSGKGIATTVPKAIAGMRAFVADVAPAHVIFISPIPMYHIGLTGYTPATCLIVAKDIRTCEFPPRPMINQVIWGAEKSVAASERVPRVNVTPLFCTSTKCALVVKDAGERLVYFDSDHANRIYIAWITSAFERLLKPAL